ncbi:hypothetical protein HMPREF2533_03876 [Bacteroides fragilis]|nr:hypothetical protein M074_0630 [Bacteroides fragilis str. DS-166]EXZ11456.1 hypothetical protein M073_0528 [Bacteroides fragilis str. DS-71]KXU41844.1 hypothetical protein HMPREF2530_03876 [Bacteroides fragilis]KXU41881.1 hypothetical protein HMPREF2533_03876 [Bacteroides fragilis]
MGIFINGFGVGAPQITRIFTELSIFLSIKINHSSVKIRVICGEQTLFLFLNGS